MIDAVIAGLVGGTFGPRLGGAFARVGYIRAASYGFILGLVVICFMFLLGFSLYEVNAFIKIYEDALSGDPRVIGDMFLATFALSFLFAFICIGLRFFGQKPTWKQAQIEFEHEGYRRSESEGGRVVTFERGRNKFIARLEPEGKPKQIEWYTDGERKGQVYLAPKWME